MEALVPEKEVVAQRTYGRREVDQPVEACQVVLVKQAEEADTSSRQWTNFALSTMSSLEDTQIWIPPSELPKSLQSRAPSNLVSGGI